MLVATNLLRLAADDILQLGDLLLERRHQRLLHLGVHLVPIDGLVHNLLQQLLDQERARAVVLVAGQLVQQIQNVEERGVQQRVEVLSFDGAE